MKLLKKIFIGLGIVLVLILAAGIILPIVFKDDIKKAIDEEIAKSVNADVVFEADNFSLSVFKNFPNVTASIKELGVFNREPFAGVPLFVVNEFQVEISLTDVLFGDQLRLKGITLVNPQINIQVMKDGKANYDIAMPSADTIPTPEEAPSSFSFGIDHWEIVNGELVYDDKSIPFFTSLKGLNHTGSGDFNEKQFDLKTFTQADSLTVGYDGTEYISNKRTEVDMVILISEEYTKYTFKENTAKLNDFALGFDGWFKMNETNYDMDITYKTKESSFKTLLSLVPGMYTSSFTGLEAKGELQFGGMVKGTYSDTQMPAFNLNAQVKDGMFKYPELPSAVNNIQMDLFVDNKDGVIDNTMVDLKKLHLDFGSNPVDASARIENLKDYRMAANVAAKLNLAELTKMFPMEGLEMKGAFNINASANGVYDSIKHIIPAVDVAMGLADGFVKSAEFPIPLENLTMASTVKNTSGKMAETIINVSNFSMMMDGERFDASAIVQNLDDYTWDIKAKGGVDIEKMMKIFPIEGMTLAGKVKADLETKGKYSDVTASRYDKLPTSGSASLKDFKYSTADLPPVVISTAEMIFDPKKIELKTLAGTIGKSDFKTDGIVTNYMGFVMGNDEVLKGNVNFNSTFMDLNEFMSETEETTAETDSASYGVIQLPKNVDFILHSNLKKVHLMDYNMTNATGDITVKDGIANLKDIKFDMLGGGFAVNGTYNPVDINHPKYDFGLKIDNLSIKEAASTFSIIKQFAPIAGAALGKFSTDFKIGGELTQDLMPNMTTVNGSGLLKIAEAAISNSKLLSGITAITKLDNTDNVTMKDVLMSATIKDGKLSVKPFDVKFGSYKTTISGSTGLGGALDYSLKMNVPAGKLGSQFQSLIGGNTNPNSEIPLNIGLGGTFLNPKPQLLMAEQKEQVKEALTSKAKEEGTALLKDVVKDTKAKDVVNNLLGTKQDTLKKDSTKTTAPVQDLLKSKMQNLLKKKKN
jgi:uncharacterized protein involved in outer membrane biogenesis